MNALSLLRGFGAGAHGLELLPPVLLLAAKATSILAVAGLVARLLGRAPAAARHLVWCCAVAALLLLPALSMALPDWEVGVWPGLAAALPAQVAAVEAVEADPAERAPAALPEELATAMDAGLSVAAGPSPERAGTDASPSGWAAWAALAWSVGALLVALRLIVGQLGLHRLRRRAEPVDASFRWLAREMAGSLGLKRQVEMLRSRGATMPMTWGVVRPTVLLPAGADAWPLERRRAVLLHELAHVKRFDCLTQTLALLCCALYWFHPGIWWAARRMRAEREAACDDAVLGAGVRPSEYAAHLLEVARAYRGAGITRVVAVAMARPSQLEGRMLAVLDAARDRSGLSRRAGGVALAAVVALLLPISALRPTARAATPESAGRSESGDTVPRAPLVAPLPPFAAELHGLALEMEAASEAILAATVEVAPEVEAALAALEAGLPEAAAAPHAPTALRHVVPALAPRAAKPAREARNDPRAVAALMEALRDSDAGVRRAAARGLGELEAPQAVAALVPALRDADAEMRQTAAWALGRIEDARAVDGLGSALRDSSSQVRRMAAWALGQIEDASAAGALVPLLRDTAAEVRKTAAWALSRMEGPAAVPALIEALRNDAAEVRSMAAHALGGIGDRRAVEPLIQALRDPSPEVRKSAAWALGEMADARAAGPLAAALDGAPAETARMIVRALGEMELAAAPQPLLDAVRSPSAEVRRAAVYALAAIGDSRAVPALRSALRDGEAEVRRAAVRALVELDDPGALDALIEALKDPDAEVRRQAAIAIADRG